MKLDRFVSVVLLLVLGSFPSFVSAQENEKKDETPTKDNTTIADIMKLAHGKPEFLIKKVAMGKATAEEQQELLQLYKVLAQLKPPKGTEDSWNQKTSLLVEATESVIAGKDGAAKQLTSASNCQSCHKEHKPK